MNNQCRIGIYSKVIFTQDIPDLGINKGEKAYVVKEKTSNNQIFVARYGCADWVPIETVMLESVYLSALENK
jgi:hypothetical protein